MRIFPQKDDRNVYMQFPPNTSLAKLKYRMINRASKQPTYVVDRTSHKKKCDVVEYARLVQHLKQVFGGDGGPEPTQSPPKGGLPAGKEGTAKPLII